MSVFFHYLPTMGDRFLFIYFYFKEDIAIALVFILYDGS